MSIFKKIWNWFKKTIKSVEVKFDAVAMEYAPQAVVFLEKLKTGIDTSEFATISGVVTALIPGNTDDRIVAAITAYLKDYLPRLCDSLDIVYKAANVENGAEKLAAIFDAVSNADLDKRSKVYIDLSAMVARYLADGKLTLSEAVVLTQTVYAHREDFGI